MISDLKHYAYNQKAFIDEGFCDKIIDELKSIKFQQHTFYNAKTKVYHTRSGDQELSMSWEDTPSKNELTKRLWKAISNYRDYIDMPWFNSWQGYTAVRFNEYKENKKMALHCDHIHSMFDGEKKGIPILSVLGVLNDDYEGGEFILFDNEVIPFEQGDLIIFPSNFMYPHKVEPVTKGTRYSNISWVW